MKTFESLSAEWLAAGWKNTLPLPRRSKYAPPKGFTGKAAQTPSPSQLQSWGKRTGNLALRMPENVIGLDIDAYKAAGRKSLKALEARLGKLPKTWRISSRDDGLSGIYLFRNVSRALLAGEAGEGIEIIQPHHRYAVAPGSIHPEGREYKLFFGDKEAQEIPSIRQLPRLPRGWVEALKAENFASKKSSDIKSNRQRRFDWETDLSLEPLPASMENAVMRFQQRVQSGGSRYNAVLKATYNIAMLSAEGVSGARQAMRQIEELYVSAVLDTRSEKQARDEFKRMVKGL